MIILSYQYDIAALFRAGTLGKVEWITGGNFLQLVTPWITSWNDSSNNPYQEIDQTNKTTFQFWTLVISLTRRSLYPVMEKFLLCNWNAGFDWVFPGQSIFWKRAKMIVNAAFWISQCLLEFIQSWTRILKKKHRHNIWSWIHKSATF